MVLKYIKSYAHAESLGIEPNDSMVSAVIDTKDPLTLLGFQSGHTVGGKSRFSSGLREYVAMSKYQEDDEEEPVRISAVSPKVARMVLKEIIREDKLKDFEMVLKTTTFRSIKL